VNRPGGEYPVHVFGLTGIHSLAKAFPMGASEALRNDHIKAIAQHFGGRKSKNSFGAPVPNPDHSAWVGEDNGIRILLHDRLEQIQLRVLELTD